MISKMWTQKSQHRLLERGEFQEFSPDFEVTGVIFVNLSQHSVMDPSLMDLHKSKSTQIGL